MTPEEFLTKIISTGAVSPADAADQLSLPVVEDWDLVDVRDHYATYRDIIRLNEDNVFEIIYDTHPEYGILNPIESPWVCRKVFADTVTYWRPVK